MCQDLLEILNLEALLVVLILKSHVYFIMKEPLQAIYFYLRTLEILRFY